MVGAINMLYRVGSMNGPFCNQVVILVEINVNIFSINLLIALFHIFIHLSWILSQNLVLQLFVLTQLGIKETG